MEPIRAPFSMTSIRDCRILGVVVEPSSTFMDAWLRISDGTYGSPQTPPLVFIYVGSEENHKLHIRYLFTIPQLITVRPKLYY